MHCDICLPAYNEELILEQSTKRLLEFCKTNLTNITWSIILIINGSHDKSPLLAQKLAELDQRIKKIIFTEPGKGRAIRKYWEQSTADILCFMDADLATDLEALPKLLAPLIKAEADLVIGDRYHQQAVVKRSFLRALSSRVYNLIAFLVLGQKQKDLQCGFKAINNTAFKKLVSLAKSDGWFFDTELIVWANKLNLKIVEIPVNWQEARLHKRASTIKLIPATIYFLKSLIKLRKELSKTKNKSMV